VILEGDVESIRVSLFTWLGMRRIYWINMNLHFYDNNSVAPSNIENNYNDQFKYTRHVIMKESQFGDDIAMFIISHSPCLQSIVISGDNDTDYNPEVTDDTFQSHCTGLQSLSLDDFSGITDTGLITISEHCFNLQSLKINNCDQITDASIISISTHCTGLQSLYLEGLQNINDASIISISEKCTGLKELGVSCTRISDASLIAIAKNCARLQYLRTYLCDELSDDKLPSYD